MPVSKYVRLLCSEAADSTYIRDSDIKAWASRPGKNTYKIQKERIIAFSLYLFIKNERVW